MSDTFADIWTDRRVKIGYETAEELAHKYNEANWRGHPEAQADALDESLDTLGWVGSVKVNLQSGKIFDGHLRVERALLKDPSITIPVDYYDLSPDEEALALQIHDAITEQAQAIPEKLAALMERTRAIVADKPGLAGMLEALRQKAGANGNSNGNGQEPEAPTEVEAEKHHKKWGAKLGDVWQLGQHVIACLDSLDESNIKRIVGDSVVGTIWADPPYGMELDASYGNSTGNEVKGIKKSRGYAPIVGDDKPFDPTPLFKMFPDIKEQFWWGADYYRCKIPNDGSWLVWDKRAGLEEVEYSASSFELCWSKAKHRRDILRVRWFGAFGTEHEPGKRRFHPTQKPVELFEQVVGKYLDSGIILDPFLGSGQSILGAEKIGRGLRVIGFELEPIYISVVLQRWADLTGLTPTLVSG